jgi:hypothetical protein
MPIDLLVEYTDGTMESFYIPLRQMHYERESNACGKRTVLSDWTWAASNYDFTIGKSNQENHHRSKRING